MNKNKKAVWRVKVEGGSAFNPRHLAKQLVYHRRLETAAPWPSALHF